MTNFDKKVVNVSCEVADTEMEICKTDGIVTHVIVDISPKVDGVWKFNECFESIALADKFVARKIKLLELISLMKKEVTEMENYSYYGSNPGIPQDCIEDLAENIIKFFENKQ